MKNTFKIAVVFLLLINSLKSVKGQQALPFYDEIMQFKKTDSTHFPPKNAVLFVGSSSFRKWEDVQAYFPDETIINRGFGGSELTDAIRYANDIIIPYQPREIVIYSGENDLAYSDTVTAQIVYARFVALFDTIRSSMPAIPLVYVSIKPSPSRENLMPKMEEANRLIKEFLQTKQNAMFADVYHKMLDKDGKPLSDIFLEDKLHMNAKGYWIWQKIIEPYLQKDKK